MCHLFRTIGLLFMINLYIDTNAYLSFFHLTNDELEELKKLHLLLNRKEIILHLPEQTKDEFYRNRDVKIADALKRYKEEKLTNQFPQFCKDYPEYPVIREAIKNFDKTKQILLDKLLADIEENKLAADLLIEKLFDKANFHPITDEILIMSKYRFDLGRPPGKNKSYGDAINWETLLAVVPEWEDFHFVSDDKDFYSEINSDNFNHYLSNEWKIAKGLSLSHYRRISQFCRAQFPDINIASDYEKEVLVIDLTESKSFSKSRSTLKSLSKFEEFSTQQIDEFVKACIENTQVIWIKDDRDIKNYITTIVNLNKEKISPDLKQELDRQYIYTM